MLDKHTKSLLYLVRLGLEEIFEENNLTDFDWSILHKLAAKHSVTAIAVDGLQCLHEQGCEIYREPLDRRICLQMYAQTMVVERQYHLYQKGLIDLLLFYQKHDIKTLLLKGYGLSLNYPKPNHRPPGDIDVYHFGYGGMVDECLRKELGITTKQNEDKHSTFVYKGLSVENHAVFMNDECHPSLRSLERFFEEDADNAIQYKIRLTEGREVSVFFPSIATNALFIPFHLGEHFVHGEASFRQVCDWYCFVKAYHSDIDWTLIEKKSKETGFFDFLCCLNAILLYFMGADTTWLPRWEYKKVLAEKVLKEILHSPQNIINMSLWKKICRFFSANWKFNMVYKKENILMASFRQARAYRRVKWKKHGISIWKKNYN